MFGRKIKCNECLGLPRISSACLLPGPETLMVSVGILGIGLVCCGEKGGGDLLWFDLLLIGSSRGRENGNMGDVVESGPWENLM